MPNNIIVSLLCLKHPKEKGRWADPKEEKNVAS